MTRIPLALLLSACAFAGCNSAPKGVDPYDIGSVHRDVSTDSDEAQKWFDRGLAMCFGFNHEEAVACFARAAEADPECAMAYWGTAYALGPNYNATEVEEAAHEAACEALVLARGALGDESPVERALIQAMGHRFASADPERRADMDRAYADAMLALADEYPNDEDVAALTAEAVMQLRPWQLWTPEGEPAPEVARIRAILEPAMERWPNHPALCHFYIHAMEAGPEVGAATAAAERLEGLVPGAGHLLHMPSHIYTWTGRYEDVVRVNLDALEADRAYVEHAGRDNFFTLYRLHNLHFVAYGCMFEGRRELALSSAREIPNEITPELLGLIPDFVDIFTATPLHVMVRFGMWEEILTEPEPEGELFAARAVWRYARGIALAVLGRVDEALAEQALYEKALADVPESRLLFNNPVVEILAVASHVLGGEIEYRRGNYMRAFELLRKAVVLDERLNYDEPWGWMEPARHALGALLTERGLYDEAIAVYRENLARYPENGWALHGLAEALEGAGDVQAAADVLARFERAWSRATVEIPGSCFCRTRP